MTYIEEVQQGMDLLASNPRTIFVGQAVEYLGHAITKQVLQYPQEKRLEFPVAEEVQAGFCLGLAIEGYIPICIYPRCNFAILAGNQIINHIDKWPLMVPKSTKPKVIIKMVVGSVSPLDPGWQHKANFALAFKEMCETIDVVDLTKAEDVLPAYRRALYDNEQSTIFIEYGDKYSE